MENKISISPEDIAILGKAQNIWSHLEYPKVRIVNPALRIAGIDVYGQRVDWFKFSQFKEESEDYLLPPHTELELFEQGLHISAAKLQLVTVKKILAPDSLTFEEAQAISDFRKSIPAGYKGRYVWDADLKGLWPDPREWMQANAAFTFEFVPEEASLEQSVYFYRFVVPHELPLEDWPYVADFLSKAESVPFKEHPILATDRVKFVTDVLKGIGDLK